LSGGLFYAILATSQTKVMLCKARIYDPETLQYDVEVEAPSISDAYTIIERREGVERKYIGTISVIDESSSSSSSGGGLDIGSTGALVILGGGLLAFFTLTPWIMMGIGGAAGTWIAQKATGYSVEEYTDSKNPSDTENKKAMAIFCAAVLLGGIGFVSGDNIKKGFDAEVNTSSTIENVRKA